MAKQIKILVIVSGKDVAYLKTVEECGAVTVENAWRAGFVIVSRNDRRVTESLTERPYNDAENACNAAKSVGLSALTYQQLAAFTRWSNMMAKAVV